MNDDNITSTNVYSAPPALPFLASSLLTPSHDGTSRKGVQVQDSLYCPREDDLQGRQYDWNLKKDFEQGFPPSATTTTATAATGSSNVFKCGIVFGFSWLRTGMTAETTKATTSGSSDTHRREREREEENYYYNQRLGEVRSSSSVTRFVSCRGSLLGILFIHGEILRIASTVIAQRLEFVDQVLTACSRFVFLIPCSACSQIFG
jgi:hypothetical protein